MFTFSSFSPLSTKITRSLEEALQYEGLVEKNELLGPDADSSVDSPVSDQTWAVKSSFTPIEDSM